MLQAWGSTIVAVLMAVTGLIWVTEFYGGRELNRKIKIVLEDWWLRIDEIKVPKLGQVEALFALSIMTRLTGPRMLSWHRVAASVAIVLMAMIASVLIPPDPHLSQFGVTTLFLNGLDCPREIYRT